jgi:hypothetical protein
VAVSIDAAGVVAGYYSDTGGVQHGFLRSSNGVFTTFDPPGSISTYPTSINAAGKITGFYSNANFSTYGFIRTPDGTFITLDLPSAYPVSINPADAITGSYLEGNSLLYGFLRNPDGSITTFDPEGSIETTPTGINPAGVIIGYWSRLGISVSVMVSCALATALSSPSILRGPSTLSPWASTQEAQLPDITATPAA